MCNRLQYAELYRQYKRRGVQLMFHAYHAGHIAPERFQAMQAAVGAENQEVNPGSTILGITMPATMHGAVANNYMWIGCPNSSARESCWPSFFVRPDGIATGRLELHTTDMLLSTVDPDEPFYDSTVAWRERAISGIFHSGTLVQDIRSEARTKL